MTTSQNGWPVDASGSGQDRDPIYPGVSVPNGVRRGDVATVLRYVAARFHHEVEPLHAGQCWGWFVKNIEGGTSISNHASGTAIDLNAPAHPLGLAGTFSAVQGAAIRKILADCDGVVRWGGNYAGRKDEMHWEIVKDAAAVHALAAKIKGDDDMPTAKEIAQALLSEDGVTNTFSDAATNPYIRVETALENASRASVAEAYAKRAADGITALAARPAPAVVLDDHQIQNLITQLAPALIAALAEPLAVAVTHKLTSDVELAFRPAT